MVLKTVSTLGATGGGGGTVTAVTGSGNIASSGGSTPNITFTGTLPVANGGTNLTSFTANGVVYASSSSALATGSALTFDGTNFVTTGSATGTAFIPSGSTVPTNGMYLPTTNTVAWSTNTTERMRLDSSGNLGLGVTPSAWGSSKALQIGGGSVWNLSRNIYVGANYYFDGTDRRYIANGFATEYLGNGFDGTHKWYNAPSGTAGNAITFTQAMTLDASGNLGIGTTSPNASAILDAQSTTKGVRMPNMTTTQKNAISSPAAGLMVFDTTLAKLCVYSGSAWQTITSV